MTIFPKKLFLKIIFIQIVLLLSFFKANSQVIYDGCSSAEVPERKLKKLPWYGNNNFLNEFLSGYAYAEEEHKVFYRIPVTLWSFSPKANEKLYKQIITDLNYYHLINNTGFEFYYADIINKQSISPVKFGYTIQAFFKGLFYREKETVNVMLVDNLVKKRIFKPVVHYKGQYNMTTKGIVLRLNSSRTSMAHEIGHFFGLYHPHRNWKRGKHHQESVSRDRIAHRLFVNAKNCELNGDAICDTPAEPNLARHTNKQCAYTADLKDNWGDVYKPQTNNIMSYPKWSKCRDNFTEKQIAVMLYTAKKKNIPEWSAADKRFEFDRNEPNDLLVNATPIVNNLVHKCNFHIKYQGKSKGLCDNDVDFFRISKDSLDVKNKKYALVLKIDSASINKLIVEKSTAIDQPNFSKINIKKAETTINLDFSKTNQSIFKFTKVKRDKELLNYSIRLIERGEESSYKN